MILLYLPEGWDWDFAWSLEQDWLETLLLDSGLFG